MKLTREQWHARATAYKEAADHLTMPWTEDSTEMVEGISLAEKLMTMADACFEKGDLMTSNVELTGAAPEKG